MTGYKADPEDLPMDRLIAIMAKLRDPDGGCPWDLEQDFRSIAPYTIEEAYEVADAIERGDMADLKEELGDLLLQPVYHAQMAAEAGLFDIHDVIRFVSDKMVARHPHVFGSETAQKAEDVNLIWDRQKAAEKPGHHSALDGVAKALPALLRSQKLLKKAGKVGFEWKNDADVLAKLDEEIGELKDALAAGDTGNIVEEAGDILFVLVNFLRRHNVDAETALREACDKFETRFRRMESALHTRGQDMSAQPLAELEALWKASKNL